MPIPEDYASKIKNFANLSMRSHQRNFACVWSRKIIYNSVLIIDFFYLHFPNLVRTVRLRIATLRRRATNAETCVLMWTSNDDTWQQIIIYRSFALYKSCLKKIILCCENNRYWWFLQGISVNLVISDKVLSFPVRYMQWCGRSGEVFLVLLLFPGSGMANTGIGVSFDPNDMTRFVLNRKICSSIFLTTIHSHSTRFINSSRTTRIYTSFKI